MALSSKKRIPGYFVREVDDSSKPHLHTVFITFGYFDSKGKSANGEVCVKIVSSGESTHSPELTFVGNGMKMFVSQKKLNTGLNDLIRRHSGGDAIKIRICSLLRRCGFRDLTPPAAIERRNRLHTGLLFYSQYSGNTYLWNGDQTVCVKGSEIPLAEEVVRDNRLKVGHVAAGFEDFPFRKIEPHVQWFDVGPARYYIIAFISDGKFCQPSIDVDGE